MASTLGQRVTRGLGWTLIVVGVHILLYLAYLLWWTNLETDAAQADLLEQFALDLDDPDATIPGAYDPTAGPVGPVEVGDAYAAMWFERDGRRIINDEVLYVVEGVSLDALRKGPGHEPRSSDAGEDGNFVISGHRTTYGAPFYNLDQIRVGDEIHVVDRDGREWIYDVAPQQTEAESYRIVQPTDVWVIRDGAYGDGPILTLTTCHPRWSAAQRLVVFAELRTGAAEAPADAADEEAAA